MINKITKSDRKRHPNDTKGKKYKFVSKSTGRTLGYGKSISDAKAQAKRSMKRVIDFMLKEVDFLLDESFVIIRALRMFSFKTWGGDGVNYLDKRIGKIVKGGKGNWGGKDDMPQMVK